MIILWFLAFVGVAINFIGKVGKRKGNKKFSPGYFLQDNWQELSQAVLWVIALMIMVMSEEAVFDFDKLYHMLPIPATIFLPTKMVASFIIGLGCTEIVYRWNKRKSKWAVEDAIDKGEVKNVEE